MLYYKTVNNLLKEVLLQLMAAKAFENLDSLAEHH